MRNYYQKDDKLFSARELVEFYYDDAYYHRPDRITRFAKQLAYLYHYKEIKSPHPIEGHK